MGWAYSQSLPLKTLAMLRARTSTCRTVRQTTPTSCRHAACGTTLRQSWALNSLQFESTENILKAGRVTIAAMDESFVSQFSLYCWRPLVFISIIYLDKNFAIVLLATSSSDMPERIEQNQGTWWTATCTAIDGNERQDLREGEEARCTTIIIRLHRHLDRWRRLACIFFKLFRIRSRWPIASALKRLAWPHRLS